MRIRTEPFDQLATEEIEKAKARPFLKMVPEFLYRKRAEGMAGMADPAAAQALMPLLFGLGRTRDLYRACTLCGACASVCPAGIDHPKLFLAYRAKDVAGDPRFRSRPRPLGERLAFRVWSLGDRPGGRLSRRPHRALRAARM
jgi:Fe-S oxidoreductase